MELDKKKVYILLFLLVIVVVVLVMNYTKNCNSNQACFDKAAEKCSRAKSILINEGNEQTYNVLGAKADSCVITVYMTRVNLESSPEVKSFLEGKGMICEVPKSELQGKSIIEVKNLNDYCTGPLKEAILQITVEKLYEIVVKSIGSVAISYQNPTA